MPKKKSAKRKQAEKGGLKSLKAAYKPKKKPKRKPTTAKQRKNNPFNLRTTTDTVKERNKKLKKAKKK